MERQQRWRSSEQQAPCSQPIPPGLRVVAYLLPASFWMPNWHPSSFCSTLRFARRGGDNGLGSPGCWCERCHLLYLERRKDLGEADIDIGLRSLGSRLHGCLTRLGYGHGLPRPRSLDQRRRTDTSDARGAGSWERLSWFRCYRFHRRLARLGRRRPWRDHRQLERGPLLEEAALRHKRSAFQC